MADDRVTELALEGSITGDTTSVQPVQSEWLYAGVSPSTGKDYWLHNKDAGNSDHYNAASFARKAKAIGLRLMSDAESQQIFSQPELRSGFNTRARYWLANIEGKNAKVQHFDTGHQTTHFRGFLAEVRLVTDVDPRLSC